MMGICAVMMLTSCSALLPPKMTAIVFIALLYQTARKRAWRRVTESPHEENPKVRPWAFLHNLDVLVRPIILDENNIPRHCHVDEGRECAWHVVVFQYLTLKVRT